MRKTHRTWTQKDIRLPKTAGTDPTPACSEPAALKGRIKTFSAQGAEETGLVELIGIEPTTSGLQSPRSPS